MTQYRLRARTTKAGLVAGALWTLWSAGGYGQAGAEFSDELASGGTGPLMITIAPGHFSMGCVSGFRCRDNTPVREVNIERPFALSVYEVTRGEFRTFVERTGYITDAEKAGVAGDLAVSAARRHQGCIGWSLADFRSGNPDTVARLRSWRRPGFSQSGDHPVVCIAWSDANEYVQWLASETGRPYRLPSEAEWEYAARAGSSIINVDASSFCEYTRDEADLRLCLGEPYTQPAGQDRPNAFGLYDMERNAYEWVEDCWSPDFGGLPTDGSAWTRGNCQSRVARRGGWGAFAVQYEVRTGSRNLHTANNQVGFRVAQSTAE